MPDQEQLPPSTGDGWFDDPTLEARLQLAFARSIAPAVPAPTSEPLMHDLAAKMAELTSEVPTASRNVAMGITKKVVAQLTSWYHDQILMQERRVNDALVAVLTDLDRRLGELEQAVAPDVVGGSPEVLLSEPDELPDAVAEAVANLIAEKLTGGRVLHAEAGRGGLVERLRTRHVDAYGVDPWIPPSGHQHHDVWQVAASPHLHTLGDGTLAGLVLSGIVDSAPTEDRLDAIAAGVRVLTAGGLIVITTETPASWSSRTLVGRPDLLAGRPLSSATWLRILELHGVEVDAEPRLVGDDARRFEIIVGRTHR